MTIIIHNKLEVVSASSGDYRRCPYVHIDKIKSISSRNMLGNKRKFVIWPKDTLYKTPIRLCTVHQ